MNVPYPKNLVAFRRSGNGWTLIYDFGDKYDVSVWYSLDQLKRMGWL